MTVLQHIVLYVAVVGTMYVAAVFVAGIWALYRRRDKLYCSKYAEFLAQKERVEERLRKDAPDD